VLSIRALGKKLAEHAVGVESGQPHTMERILQRGVGVRVNADVVAGQSLPQFAVAPLPEYILYSPDRRLSEGAR